MENITEALNKLKKIDEAVDSTTNVITMPIELVVDDGVLDDVRPADIELCLIIPEGVTSIGDWPLDKIYKQVHLTKVVFPESLTILNDLFFSKPKEDFIFEFKGDVISRIILPIALECIELNDEDDDWEWAHERVYDIINASGNKNKETLIKKFICDCLGVYYNRSTLIFDVPLDINKLMAGVKKSTLTADDILDVDEE